MKTESKGWLYNLLAWLFGKMPTPAPLPIPEPVPSPTPAPEPPQASGPRITKIKHGGKWDINVSTEGCDSWPVKAGKKDTVGKLMMKPANMSRAVYVDAMRPDQMHGAKKELTNAYGPPGEEHALDVMTGEPVEVWVASYDGRKTATFEWKWPFAPT